MTDDEHERWLARIEGRPYPPAPPGWRGWWPRFNAWMSAPMTKSDLYIAYSVILIAAAFVAVGGLTWVFR